MKLFLIFAIAFAAMMATSFSTNAGESGYSDHSSSKAGNNSEANANAGALGLAGASVDSHDNVHSNSYGSDLSRGVPNVITPNPAVGFAVCDSAYTFSLGFSGLGAGIGVPVSDGQCNLREDAKTTKMLGEPVIAKEMMCTSVRFFKSSYRAGRPCFPDKEMLEELSEGEMEIYHNVLARRAEAEEIAIIQSLKPAPPQELVRTGRISLSTKNSRR